MRGVRPALRAPSVVIAEEQEEFKPITGALVAHPAYPATAQRDGKPVNSVVLAFTLTAEERRRIAEGEDLYVSLLTFGGPMQGIICSVGPEEMAGWFGVEVDR